MSDKKLISEIYDREIKSPAPNWDNLDPTEKWIGVDLDSTLAYYTKWIGPGHIGEPIPAMLEKVKRLLEQGKAVKIFTARADEEANIIPIQNWCKKHLGKVLPITNVKDGYCEQIWDDKAKQVIKNEGRFIDE